MVNAFTMTRWSGAVQEVVTLAAHNSNPWPGYFTNPGPGFLRPMGSFAYPADTGNNSWTADKPGLYELNVAWDVPGHFDGGFFLFWSASLKNDYDSVYRLMSGLATICVYGDADESVGDTGTNGWNNRPRMRKIALACGNTTQFAMLRLREGSVKCRDVHTLTDDLVPTNWNDGHVGCETNIGGSIQFWDLANDRIYKDASGNHLSLAGLIALGFENAVIEKIGPCQCHPGDGWSSTDPNRAVVFDQMEGSDAAFLDTFARLYRLPCVYYAGGAINGTSYASGYYFTIPPGANNVTAWVQSLHYSVAPYADWLVMQADTRSFA